MALPDEGPHVHLDPFENTPHTILREYHIEPPSNQQTQMGIVPSIDLGIAGRARFRPQASRVRFSEWREAPDDVRMTQLLKHRDLANRRAR
jgi:hypothetical protein